MRKLLFELATWHGLAKLWLHTETTVNNLEHSTTWLGTALCNFEANVCSTYTTPELPSEEAACVRRRASAAKKANTQLPKKPIRTGKLAPQSKWTCKFNLSTYKLHTLGHYPRAIRLFGTSDNFNSQMVWFFPVSFNGIIHCSTRVSSNTDEQSGFISMYTKANMSWELDSKYNESVLSTVYRSETSTMIPHPMQVELNPFLHLLLTWTTTYQWIHVRISNYISG